jgi:uncharacterized protein
MKRQSDVTVYKLDERGQKVWQYPARLLAQGGSFVRLEASFNRDDMELGFATFKRGDRFIEYFYTDRWYNIFAVYDRDSEALKGWYCNVCRPAVIEDDAVYSEDLALDLWHTPGQSYPLILDEDEFAALEISPHDRQQARQALNQLTHLAQQNQLPR